MYNRYIFNEIRKGMHGLPIAGNLANDELKINITPYGYTVITYTPGFGKTILTHSTFYLMLITLPYIIQIRHILTILKNDW